MSKFESPKEPASLKQIKNKKQSRPVVSEKVVAAISQVDHLDHFDVDEVIKPFKGLDLHELRYANVEISEEVHRRSAIRNRDSRRLYALTSRLLDLAYEDANIKK